MADSTTACVCTTDAGAGCVSSSIVLLLESWLIIIRRGWSLGVSSSTSVFLPPGPRLVIRERHAFRSTKLVRLQHRSFCQNSPSHCCDQRRRLDGGVSDPELFSGTTSASEIFTLCPGIVR